MKYDLKTCTRCKAEGYTLLFRCPDDDKACPMRPQPLSASEVSAVWQAQLQKPGHVEFEPVSGPAHYTAGEVECIDAIRAAMTVEQFRGYLRGNAFKYLWRYEHKGGMSDLEKGIDYFNRLRDTYLKSS